jgi:hypothetical protein
LYTPFYGGGCGLKGSVFPYGVWGDKDFAMFYSFSDLVSEGFGSVCAGSLEFVFIYESVYFGFILLCREDD